MSTYVHDLPRQQMTEPSCLCVLMTGTRVDMNAYRMEGREAKGIMCSNENAIWECCGLVGSTSLFDSVKELMSYVVPCDQQKGVETDDG